MPLHAGRHFCDAYADASSSFYVRKITHFLASAAHNKIAIAAEEY